ncbi:8006_t:CDS:2, partial [Racocetra persica]
QYINICPMEFKRTPNPNITTNHIAENNLLFLIQEQYTESNLPITATFRKMTIEVAATIRLPTHKNNLVCVDMFYRQEDKVPL